MDSRISKLKKVLLIDDDEIFDVTFIRILLQAQGFTGQVDHVKDGYEGLLYISDQWVNRLPYPDIIFVNLVMPVMDGFEFLQHCRTAKYFENQPVKLIMFTKADHPSIIKEAYSYGIHGYMNKPFWIPNLLPYM